MGSAECGGRSAGGGGGPLARNSGSRLGGLGASLASAGRGGDRSYSISHLKSGGGPVELL